jgi:hypothetical protein
MEFIKPEKIWLADHSELNEKWVQDRIAEDPSLLGLGDLMVRDKERTQPRAGRLDLLLQDPESDRRYEVEIQLGATDESHIIRTLEYWDIERKRYPQYDHCAVLVAEDITSRFLNVIGLFNGSIPVIAIQMRAMKIGDKVALMFTTVLDELTRGLVEEDEEVAEAADREYWEVRGSKDTVAMADDLLRVVKTLDPKLELKFNRHYIGLARNGQPDNFIYLWAKKAHLNVAARIPKSEDMDRMLQDAEIEVLTYNKSTGTYRFRVDRGVLTGQGNVLQEVARRAYQNKAASR